MKFGGKTLVVVCAVGLVTLFMLAGVAGASSDWRARPGTIRYSLSLPDSSHVYLDAVRISKIRARQSPAYVVVSEFFSWQDKLILLTPPSPELRISQTVDVEGDMATLDCGD